MVNKCVDVAATIAQLWLLAYQCFHNWSRAGERQLRPAGWQQEQLIPAEPAWSSPRWRSSTVIGAPRGNLGRTLSASLVFCSIWTAPPPALEGLTLLYCLFLFQVCLFTLVSRTPPPSHNHLDISDMSEKHKLPSLFVWTFFFWCHFVLTWSSQNSSATNAMRNTLFLMHKLKWPPQLIVSNAWSFYNHYVLPRSFLNCQ